MESHTVKRRTRNDLASTRELGPLWDRSRAQERPEGRVHIAPFEYQSSSTFWVARNCQPCFITSGSASSRSSALGTVNEVFPGGRFHSHVQQLFSATHGCLQMPVWIASTTTLQRSVRREQGDASALWRQLVH